MRTGSGTLSRGHDRTTSMACDGEEEEDKEGERRLRVAVSSSSRRVSEVGDGGSMTMTAVVNQGN